AGGERHAGGPTDSSGRDPARSDRAQAERGGPAAPGATDASGAEDGGAGNTGRRSGSRFQQCPDGNTRFHGPGAGVPAAGERGGGQPESGVAADRTRLGTG